MTSFAPVFLAPENTLNNRVSQTMLRMYTGCNRAGFLYAETKGRVQTAEMLRGACAHEVFEHGTNLMIENNEPTLPPELAKVLVGEALHRHPLPIWEHDYLRELCFRWAEEWTVVPDQVLAVERLIVLEVVGWQVRCKVDFGERRDRQLYVADLKTAKGAPSLDSISRKRRDGKLAPRTLQLILYGLAMVYGKPVTTLDCPQCDGVGYEPDSGPFDAVTPGLRCARCDGRGRIEQADPFPLAADMTELIAEFVYPGIEKQDGLMLRRPLALTRMELDQYGESLEAILSHLSESARTGDWPAVVSDQACGECPASALCPIPAELRAHRGTINTQAELEEACERYYRDEKDLRARRAEIKATAKRFGNRVRYGADRVWEYADAKTTTTIPDKDGLFGAVQESIEYGVPFEKARWVKESTSTPFVDRGLSDEELDEEAAQQEEVRQ